MNKKWHNEYYQTVRLFEAFSGIGSQYQALKNIAKEKKWKIEQVGIIEWYIPAIIAYQAIHYYPKNIRHEYFNNMYTLSFDSKKACSKQLLEKKIKTSNIGFWLNQSKNIAHNLFDISQVDIKDIPKNIDIFTYSFPCQDISHQGLQKGFSKNSNTRSSLLWQIDRLLSEIKQSPNHDSLPKYLLMENVKAIINTKNISTLKIWIRRLNELGYESQYYLLNSSNFDNPQNRERVFLLSVLKVHKEKVDFDFPDLESIIKTKKTPIKKILDKDNNQFESKFTKYQLIEKPINKNNNVKKFILQNYTKFSSENYAFDINYCGTTLTASGAMSRIKLYYGLNQIREMNARECFLYMGFKKDDYLKSSKTKMLTKNQLIYLCGNSIVISVLEAIFKKLKF